MLFILELLNKHEISLVCAVQVADGGCSIMETDGERQHMPTIRCRLEIAKYLPTIAGDKYVML